MVTLREGNVRGREQLGKNEYFFEVALGMLSYMQESFVLDSTRLTCSTSCFIRWCCSNELTTYDTLTYNVIEDLFNILEKT